MKRLALLLLLTACATTPVDPDPGIARMQGFIAKDPKNPALHYALARNYDRTRDLKNVLSTLRRLDRFGWTLGVWPEHFRNSRDDAEFQRLAAKLDAREQAVHRATAAFTFTKERNVRSEGVAYDSVDDRFYFSGSAGALLRVDRDGTVSELAVEPLGASFERMGMRVDAERRQLWMVAAVFDAAAPAHEKGRSALAVYDLRDGRLLRRIDEGAAERRSILNDLTLLRDGTAFVTDTERHQLLRLAPGASAFEIWLENFRAPNGVVHSSDHRTLYVADFFGIHAIDVATKTLRLLKTARPLHAIDGMAEHRDTLIAIQNNMGRPRVLRIDPAHETVEVLEAKNSLVTGPASGVVAGDEFFFLTNRFGPPAERAVFKIAL